MQPFQTILFAADFSENSTAAFRVACRLATERATRLVVLHVIEPDWVAKRPDYLGEGADSPSETESLGEFLKRRMAELYVPSHPLCMEFCATEGSAAFEIIRMAEEIKADLIVMGTHGRTGLDRLLAGSIAESVLRNARCPVLALRSPTHLIAIPENRDEAVEAPHSFPGADARASSLSTKEQEAARLSIRTILYPTDFSECSEAALPEAVSVARDQGARLIVLHVTPVEQSPAVPMDPRFYWDALEEVRGRLERLDLNHPVEVYLRHGDAAEEILGSAKELQCDLIVMGTHGRSGLGRILMGSVAEAVLRGARCPVLTVRVPLAAAEISAAREAATAP